MPDNEESCEKKDILSLCEESLRKSEVEETKEVGTSEDLSPTVDKANMIHNLQPVTVPASNENSTDESNEQSLRSTAPPLISREGRRRQKYNSPASMIHHNVKRMKKTSD